MSSQQSPTNYARYGGIYKSELAGAIVLIVAYAILFVFNLIRSIRHPTYVLIVLSIFCIIRVTAFTLRAILAGSDTAGQNLSLYVAESVLYSAGFFGLLYSAYTLVLDRQAMIVGTNPTGGVLGTIQRLMRNRHLIRIILMVAVALGITGGVKAASSSQSDQNDAMTFRRASIYIFLVVCCLLVIVTAQLAVEEHSGVGRDYDAPVGRKYRLLVLLVIATMCLVREAFFTATATNTKQQNNAHLWYPLAALTELLAVMLFATPGLVPSRSEIAREKQTKEGSYGALPLEQRADTVPLV